MDDDLVINSAGYFTLVLNFCQFFPHRTKSVTVSSEKCGRRCEYSREVIRYLRLWIKPAEARPDSVRWKTAYVKE